MSSIAIFGVILFLNIYSSQFAVIKKSWNKSQSRFLRFEATAIILNKLYTDNLMVFKVGL